MNMKDRLITPEERAEFVDYVCGYYLGHEDGWGGWGHDTTPLTREEVEYELPKLLANYGYVDGGHPLGHTAPLTWDGGSHDREVLANLILVRRHPDWIDRVEHSTIVKMVLRAK
jgi:hypothetical protein